MLKKKGMSFVGIIAIIGVILIALGFAWLIAQNWHNFHAAIKIFILVAVTSASYILGVVFREKEYPKIGESLIILGSLLYTLSIFLIAQIFFTPSGPQGIAWLFLICWIGVLIAGYLLNSKILLIIAGAEFIIWTFVQSAAFSTGLFSSSSSYRSVLIPFFQLTGLGIAGTFLAYTFTKNKKLFRFLVGIIISFLIYFASMFIFKNISLLGAAFVVFLGLIIFTATVYLSKFKEIMPITFLYFLLWITIQSFALFKHGNLDPSISYFMFLFFVCGIFFYGVGLLHRSYKHPFSIVFKLATIIYFLIFISVLGFKYSILFLCDSSFTLSSAPAIFLFSSALLSLIVLISGIFISFNKNIISKKEILVVILLILVILGLIFLTKLPENTLGTCSLRSCNEFKDINSCDNAPKILNCVWKYSYCGAQSCYDFKDENSCNNVPEGLFCYWNQNRCSGSSYQYDFHKDLCKSNNNFKEGCVLNEECKWQTSYSDYIRASGNMPFKLWSVWLVIKLFIIIFISLIIWKGYTEKTNALIILGIIFFILNMISREDILLTLGLLAYGIPLFLQFQNNKLSRFYKLGAVFYFLLFSYILSFQIVIPRVWGTSPLISGYSFIASLIMFSLISVSGGILISKAYPNTSLFSKKEVFAIITMVILLLGLVALTGITTSNEEVSGLFWKKSLEEISFNLWFVWIIINVFFILLILAVIAYGSLEKSPGIINLGIAFFILDIITRYIGFIMDFWGYTSLAILFITGGVLLIFGGWVVTRWRKRLVEKTKRKQKQTSKISLNKTSKRKNA